MGSGPTFSAQVVGCRKAGAGASTLVPYQTPGKGTSIVDDYLGIFGVVEIEIPLIGMWTNEVNNRNDNRHAHGIMSNSNTGTRNDSCNHDIHQKY